jgi:DNA-binding transcriptional MerR regulator
VRIAELSGRSGVPVPTIKYYLREGLLPPGESTQRNQASYDEGHLQRLRLVRVLLDIGRLPIAAIRDLLADLDRPDPDLHFALGRALKSASHQPDLEPVDADIAMAESEVDALVERRGWRVADDAPARRRVAEVLAAQRRLGMGAQAEMIEDYANAVEAIAALDLRLVSGCEPEAMLYRAVIATILGDALIAGLRRLAQEDASARTFGHPDPEPKPAT